MAPIEKENGVMILCIKSSNERPFHDDKTSLIHKCTQQNRKKKFLGRGAGENYDLNIDYETFSDITSSKNILKDWE